MSQVGSGRVEQSNPLTTVVVLFYGSLDFTH